MIVSVPRPLLQLLLLFGIGSSAAAASPAIDFNRDIRPILSENCFYCHGQDAQKRQADLRLDVREDAIAAGAVVPGRSEASELVRRIHASDPESLMPPADSNRRLTDAQKQLLQQWIEQGANYTNHWAYQSPTEPDQPPVKQSAWIRTPLDRFILARLEANGLQPAPEADRATLIRRLAIDLVGLPPSLEEVEQFVSDPDPRAYEKLVERFLADPHYGERMALPWLDAARYADSNGFQQDGDTWQWIWRDWVVRAMNEDLPFDQFTIWQLAGDLLPDATLDQKIASGFNRNHLLNGEGGAIPEEQRFVNLFDRVDTTATTWLGLTMACAQCHDHKYDPITQRDYYSLLDAFNRVPETGTPQYFSPRIRVGNPVLELPTEENKAQFARYETDLTGARSDAQLAADAAFQGWLAGLLATSKPAEGKGLPETLAAILRKAEGERSEEEKKTLAAELRKHFDEKVRAGLIAKIPALEKVDRLQKELNAYRGDKLPRVMVMSDAQPRETKILSRGDYLSPLEKVSFNTPAFLPPLPENAPKNRLGLAQWLVSPGHPLTARVQVNRMWQHFFGAGLVTTPEDFGVQSEYPSHLQLLDWLALEFQRQEWSVKSMHRLIVLSATYRQSSRVTAEQREKDSANRLFGRGSRFRMPAPILRDWALASAGLLDTRIGGAPVYPYQPEGIWEALAITKERDFTYPQSKGADLYRRSLYTFWRRTVGPANMFDVSNRQACRVRTSLTSTPLHALTTLNDATWVEAARRLAESSLHSADSLEQRLAHPFRRVLSRAPTEQELAALRRAYEKQREIYKQDPAAAQALLNVGEAKTGSGLDPVEHAALSAVCLAILNLDEALTRE